MPVFDLTIRLRLSANDRDQALDIGQQLRAPDGTTPWEVEAEQVSQAEHPSAGSDESGASQPAGLQGQ